MRRFSIVTRFAVLLVLVVCSFAIPGTATAGQETDIAYPVLTSAFADSGGKARSSYVVSSSLPMEKCLWRFVIRGRNNPTRPDGPPLRR